MRLVTVVFVLLLCAVSSGYAAPHLQVETTSIDWGKIYSGAQRDGFFVLHNSGDAALVVSKVKSS